MKIPEFQDDLNIISKLGDNPGADNDLTAEGLKAKFDEGSLTIQQYLNGVLIAKLNEIFSEGGQLNEGLIMTGPINMNQQMLFGLKNPVNESEPVNLGFAEQYYAPKIHVSDKNNPHGVTAAQVGAAPSGYGLGDGGISLSSLGLTVDTIARGGFYRWDVHEGTPFSFAAMIVAPRTGNTSAAQLAFCHAGENRGVMATRMYAKDANIPWEYINPPMVLGTEYRTTERYNGKPVYVRAIDAGTLPNNNFKQYSVGISYTNIVDFYMLAKNASTQYVQRHNNGDTFWYESNYFVCKTGWDASGFTGTIIFKYTK